MASDSNVASEATSNQPKLVKCLGSELGNYGQPSTNWPM